MVSSSGKPVILLLGATGQLGKLIAKHLRNDPFCWVSRIVSGK